MLAIAKEVGTIVSLAAIVSLGLAIISTVMTRKMGLFV